MLDKQEYLITKLIEECVEVAQRGTKILTFGKDEIQEGQALTNEERLLGEFYDLLGVFEMLVENKILRDYSFPDIKEAIDAKKKKVTKYMDYSREKCGTLQ